MSSSSKSIQDVSVWSYVPIDQFSAPAEPPSEAVLGGIRAIWAQVWPWHPGQHPEPKMALQSLRTAPTDLLDRLVPTPEWQPQAREALTTTLRDWTRTAAENAGKQILISAPFCKGAEIIAGWADAHEFQVVGPPTHQQILDQDTTWLDQMTGSGNGRIVFPNLGRMFLRHHDGLALVRRLFELIADPAYSCLIGCQSWAWEFLQKSCPVNLPNTQIWSLAPLDKVRLSAWVVRELIASDLADRVTFRRTDNGKLAIDPSNESHPNSASMNVFEQITARSRGNPAVAWSLWRRTLSIATDESVNEEAQAEARQDDKRTIWVRDWETVNLPTVPTSMDTEGLQILHAILLHDGLHEDLLFTLLPGHRPALVRTVAYLSQLDLIRFTEARQWHINDVAYPSVRQRLRRDGYLIDNL